MAQNLSQGCVTLVIDSSANPMTILQVQFHGSEEGGKSFINQTKKSQSNRIVITLPATTWFGTS